MTTVYRQTPNVQTSGGAASTTKAQVAEKTGERQDNSIRMTLVDKVEFSKCGSKPLQGLKCGVNMFIDKFKLNNLINSVLNEDCQVDQMRAFAKFCKTIRTMSDKELETLQQMLVDRMEGEGNPKDRKILGTMLEAVNEELNRRDFPHWGPKPGPCPGPFPPQPMPFPPYPPGPKPGPCPPPGPIFRELKS